MQRIFVALLFCLGLAFPALAALPERQCAITQSVPPEEGAEQTACPPLTPFQAIHTTDYDAVRSNIGQAPAPIDVWDRCRYVDNSSTDKSAFVPFKSELEWNAFITGHPDYLGLVTCARPMTANLAPNADCAEPSPVSQAVNLPYARTGTVLSKSATFTCAPAEDGCPTWTQTVQTNFTALNSDLESPSWAAGASNYSGEPPSCGITAACGTAHGSAVSSAPTTNLCEAGEASVISGTGPWTWTCAGTNGGSDASCTAPISAQAGVCGPANGVVISESPSSGLCTTGMASSVSGSGPWAWTCAGTNGGSDASCSAPASTPSACLVPRDVYANWRGIAMSSDGTKLAAAAISGEIYTSTDGGITWTPRDSESWTGTWEGSEESWTGIASSADGMMLAATSSDGGRIYTSADGGVTWTARASNNYWYNITSSADGTKLAAVASLRIYVSNDSGVTWTARGPGQTWWDIASSADGTKLAAVGYLNGRVYTSADSGITWTARTTTRSWTGIASSADGTKLAAVADNAQIYTSTDSGVTWTARESTRDWTDIASSADGTKLVAVAWRDGVYTSLDSGATWTRCPLDVTSYRGIAMSADGANLAVAGDGAIYTYPGTGP